MGNLVTVSSKILDEFRCLANLELNDEKTGRKYSVVLSQLKKDLILEKKLYNVLNSQNIIKQNVFECPNALVARRIENMKAFTNFYPKYTTRITEKQKEIAKADLMAAIIRDFEMLGFYFVQDLIESNIDDNTANYFIRTLYDYYFMFPAGGITMVNNNLVFADEYCRETYFVSDKNKFSREQTTKTIDYYVSQRLKSFIYSLTTYRAKNENKLPEEMIEANMQLDACFIKAALACISEEGYKMVEQSIDYSVADQDAFFIKKLIENKEEYSAKTKILTIGTPFNY